MPPYVFTSKKQAKRELDFWHGLIWHGKIIHYRHRPKGEKPVFRLITKVKKNTKPSAKKRVKDYLTKTTT